MLTSILTKAYAQGYTHGDVRYPPVDSSSKSPFLEWEVNEVVWFLCEYATGTVVDAFVFLVGDRRTLEDKVAL